MRRVVITGLGLLTPLGCGVDVTWKRLIEGESGAGPITRFDASEFKCQVACEVPLGDGADGTFKADDWVTPKNQRRMDTFILYGLAAGQMAVEDAGWMPEDEESLIRTGVIMGAGIGGLPEIERSSITLRDEGPRRVSPFFIPRALINLASGQLSIKYGFQGPNHAVVTACSSGAHAIGDGARMIMLDDADVMVAGGTEATVNPIGVAGFDAAKALSTHFNDQPERASRPYDRDRDGFVMGEGSGVVVLEELEHAKKRGARIYAEVVGYGMSGDAYHITAPAEDGNGAFRAMKMALERAKLDPSEIDYVNAHGTSTPRGDEIELGAVTRLFGSAASNLYLSSTKSSIGHLLGAAGSVEAIFCILAMTHGVVPPTLNLDNPSVETEIDLIAHTAKERDVRIIMSNSFGFGGTNASLILKRFS